MVNFVQETKAYKEKAIFKDYYPFLIKFIKKNKIKNIIDIGCASGHFFKYLPNELGLNGFGIDISEELILHARKINKKQNFNFEKINFFSKKNKLSNNFIKKNKLKNYDLINMLGTISTIKNYNLAIKKLTELRPKNIIIQTPLNPNNYDVRISHRKNSFIKFNTAYNIISSQNIIKILRKYNYKVSIITYTIKKNILKNKKNPLRNYHLHLKNGKKILTNGISCLLNEYIVIATKKK